jgi:hypothetical protein
MDSINSSQLSTPDSSPEVRGEPWCIINRPKDSEMFGLCALESTVYASRPIEDALLEVEVGGEIFSLPTNEVNRPLQTHIFAIRFHVNSHLLENGRQTLSVWLRWPDCERVSAGKVTLKVSNTTPLAEEVRRDLQLSKAPLVFGQIVDSTIFPYATGSSKAWFDEMSIEDLPLSLEPAADADTARRHLIRWGFAILPETLPEEVIRSFNREIDEAIERGQLVHSTGSSERIHNAHLLPSGRKLWLYPPVLSFLEELFRDEPCACQTLLYINGSEQSAHQDTIHLTPYPAGYMCGVWIALEDIQKDSGELIVYPGSHRSPRLRASELGLEKVSEDYSAYVKFDTEIAKALESEGFTRVKYMPKAGQILIWHENLIHGGSRRLDLNLTRRSIVSHYFAKGGIAYYDSRGEAAALESTSDSETIAVGDQKGPMGILDTNLTEVMNALEAKVQSADSEGRDLHPTFGHIDDDLFALLTQKAFKGYDAVKAALPDYPSEDINRDCTGTLTLHDSVKESLAFWKLVKEIFRSFNPKPLSECRVVDYGAGWGRITRFCGKDVKSSSLYAVEPNPTFCKIFEETRVPGTLVPTEYQSASVLPFDGADLLISFSILTHTSDALAHNVRDRWAEIMAPGGVVVFTIRPGAFLECVDGEMTKFTAEERQLAIEQYRQGGLAYKAYADSPDWGITIAPMTYISRLFEPYFDIVGPHLFFENTTQLPIVMIRK